MQPSVPPVPRTRHTPRADGFTLVELLITLVIAGLLLALAVPSFNRLMASSRLTTQANNAVNLLSYARAEAAKRGVNVQISANGAITALPPNAASQALTQAVTMPAGISSTSPVATLIATPLGLLRAPSASTGYAGLVADLSSTALSTDNHRCIYLYTGTMVASCTDSQTCNASAPNATCK
ncbi:MAG: prepilin-type N-terminal cleavage/methylation domain-containing protein [Burkholderiaceae bacterium]|nr:prepilin-type N-terminal cleavage/methylation domain-containing protein [Burkholderiaceae bacterium]